MNLHCSGLYIIKNLVNNKFYIGSSKNIYNRWFRGHLPTLRLGRHANSHLQKSFNSYGENFFEIKILLICDINLLQFYEQRFLDKYVGLEECYNIGKDADCPNRGVPMTEGQKQVLREKNLGKKYGKATREKLRKIHTNRIFSLEHRQNISKSKIGVKKTKEHIEKIKLARKKQKSTKGKFSKEDIIKIREIFSTGKTNRTELAKQFNTSTNYISQIVNFKKWLNV